MQIDGGNKLFVLAVLPRGGLAAPLAALPSGGLAAQLAALPRGGLAAQLAALPRGGLAAQKFGSNACRMKRCLESYGLQRIC